MLSSIDSIQVLLKTAPFLIRAYEEKASMLDIQHDMLNDPDVPVPEKLIIGRWVANNSKFILDNAEQYNRCKSVLHIKELSQGKLEQIIELYNNLYNS